MLVSHCSSQRHARSRMGAINGVAREKIINTVSFCRVLLRSLRGDGVYWQCTLSPSQLTIGRPSPKVADRIQFSGEKKPEGHRYTFRCNMGIAYVTTTAESAIRQHMRQCPTRSTRIIDTTSQVDAPTQLNAHHA